MVLTHGEHLDVLDHYHLVVVLVKHGVVEYLCDKTALITTIHCIGWKLTAVNHIFLERGLGKYL
jgi:hypothetical protein